MTYYSSNNDTYRHPFSIQQLEVMYNALGEFREKHKKEFRTPISDGIIKMLDEKHHFNKLTELKP